MKSFITLLIAGSVLFASGQFFGWWNAPIPGVERIPSYEARKNTREAKRMAMRKAAGLDKKMVDDETSDAQRRSNALRNGGGLNAAQVGQ